MLDPLDVLDTTNKRWAEIKGQLFISVEESAKKNRISRTRIFQLMVEGRIQGCYRVGSTWIIPANWRYKRKRKRSDKSEDS